jgi:formate dehydrogenase accessory protein FdhE
MCRCATRHHLPGLRQRPRGQRAAHRRPGAGHRYLHCGLCATEWHMVRVKCTHCESTKGVAYQGIEGDAGVVLAETCAPAAATASS